MRNCFHAFSNIHGEAKPLQLRTPDEHCSIDSWQKCLRVGRLSHSTKSPVNCEDLSSHEGTLGIEPRVWTPGWCFSSCKCVVYRRENSLTLTLIQNFKVNFYLSKGRRVQSQSVFSLCSKNMFNVDILCMHMWMYIYVGTYVRAHMEVKGQLSQVSSLLQPFLSSYLPGYPSFLLTFK